MSIHWTERFWAKVDQTGDCWLWTAGKDSSGYGSFRLGKMRPAHRVAYELANGAITEGMEIDHICHVRACVRATHLREVTHKQNQENVLGARRNSKSGVLGVLWVNQPKPWRAEVTHNTKLIHVGSFTSIDEAKAAVIAKRNQLFTHNNLDRSIK